MAGPRSPLYGVGINDADYFTQREHQPDGTHKRWVCPYYQKWRQVLERVYCPKMHKKQPCYVGTSIEQSWHSFMTFRAWLIEQGYDGSTQLDKDLLVQGNKHYGPRTAALVPPYLNFLLLTRDTERGEYPIGVTKRSGPYNFTKPLIAQCSNGKGFGCKHLGYFSDPKEAHKAWQQQKIIQINLTLSRYRKEPCYREDVDKAILSRVSQLEFELAAGIETTFL